MTGNGETAGERKPRIVIEFDGEGSALATITPEGPLIPGQVYGAAWLFDTWARETRTRELMTAGAGPGQPNLDVSDLLRNLGLGGLGRVG